MHYNGSTQRGDIGGILLQSFEESLIIVNPQLEFLRVTAIGFVKQDGKGKFSESVLDGF